MPTDPWDEMVVRARHLEQSGYDHLWVYDHLTWRRYRERAWLSTVAWMAGMAVVTSTIELGTMVLNPNIRHPLTAAKDLASLDQMSDGRLLAGIGAGGLGYDATVFGETELTPGERIERLDEFIRLLDRLWAGEPVDHAGRHYSLDDALVLPRPHRRPRPPVLVAAGRRRGLDLAGRRGDGWITWGDTSLTDLSAAGTDRVVSEQMAGLRQAVASAGRSFDDLRRVFLIGNTEAQPLASVDEFMSFAHRYAEMGFTDLVFHHPRPDDPVWDTDPAVVDGIAERMDEIAAFGSGG